MNGLFYSFYESPIGILRIVTDDKNLLALDFCTEKEPNSEILPEINTRTLKQLDEYFKGIRKSFDLEMHFEGTEFQLQVWNALKTVEYGTIVTYKDIAEKINNPKAVRAVGGANNRNRIAIIVPCHRVIGTDGKLIGYAGGVWRKEWLINHEKNNK